MLKQYKILTMCLSELEKSPMPAMEKLKIEVQLIQTKRLLLYDDVEVKVNGITSSEDDFNALYERIRHVCGSEKHWDEVEELVGSIVKLKENLTFSKTKDAC